MSLVVEQPSRAARVVTAASLDTVEPSAVAAAYRPGASSQGPPTRAPSNRERRAVAAIAGIMNARLLLCLAALPAAVDALGEFHAEEVKTTCPTLVPLRLNQTNTAGSLMSTGTVAVLDSDYQGSDKPAVIVVQEWWGLNEEHIKKAQN